MTAHVGPTDTQFAVIRSQLLTEVGRRQNASKRHQILAASAIAFAVVVGSTAAAVVAHTASVDQRNVGVDCYTSANLSAPHGTTALADDGRDKARLQPLSTRVGFALELCEAGWHATPTDSNVPDNVDVPNPTVCQLGDGRLAVFPNKTRRASWPSATALASRHQRANQPDADEWSC